MESYVARNLKRSRATAAEMEARRVQLRSIVAEAWPMTVRQVYYQATLRGLVDKTDSGYNKVQRALANLRSTGALPWSWIADLTRWQRKPRSYDSLAHALEETEAFYRRSLWSSSKCYVEIWLEKDALMSAVYPVTAKYDVPLMPARGYSSLSFLAIAAECLDTLDVPAFVYHLGDYDPSGVNAGEKIEQTLRKLAPKAVIHFERLGVNPDQIAKLSLPSRQTKASDPRAKKFASQQSVELDAIHPQTLRDIVESAILRHISPHELAVAKVAEESEKQMLGIFQHYARKWQDEVPAGAGA